MPMRIVTRFEFVCDSCGHITTKDEDAPPRAWRTVHRRDGKELMVCGSCAAQIERALTILGEYFTKQAGYIYVATRPGGVKCTG